MSIMSTFPGGGGVSKYIHTRTGTVHNFVGMGGLGYAHLTAAYVSGDTFKINGASATLIGTKTDLVANGSALFGVQDGVIYLYSVSNPFAIPAGGTVTPINNVEKWLNCAGIQYADVGSPSLATVVANESLCTTLMNSANAVAYMIRSTTIQTAVLGSTTALAALDASSPFVSAQMSSNSQPSGYVATASADGCDTQYAYRFTWQSGGQIGFWAGAPNWGCMKLPQTIWPYRIQVTVCVNNGEQWSTGGNVKFQASIDGTNWTDITDSMYSGGLFSATLTARTTKYNYFRFYIISANGLGKDCGNFKVWGK